jgi:uncharacterized membrane protein YdbT with pleckstrin-like domain
MANNTLIWQDKKRYLGMPISFTRYSLSPDRLFLSVGFFTIRDEEILLYRIRDITTTRTLWQRLFGLGTVTVSSSDKTMPVLVIKNIKNPLAVKELIHENVEVSKRKHRVRVSEISGDFDTDDDGIADDMDDDI